MIEQTIKDSGTKIEHLQRKIMTAKMPISVLVSDRSVFHYAKGIKFTVMCGKEA